MNVTWRNSLGNAVFFGLCGTQILKITYMSYLGKVFDSLTKKIQTFQRSKNFRRFRVFVLGYRANLKRRKWRKTYKASFQWQINEWGAIFMSLNWSFRLKVSKKLHLGRDLLSGKQWKSRGAIVWEN